MANYLKQLITSPMRLLDELIIENDDISAYNTLQQRLESSTKSSGARIIIVMTSPTLAALILKAADEVLN